MAIKSKDFTRIYGVNLPNWVLLESTEQSRKVADWYGNLPRLLTEEYYYKADKPLDYPQKYYLTKRR